MIVLDVAIVILVVFGFVTAIMAFILWIDKDNPGGGR